MKKRLENALHKISVPNGLDEAVAKGIMRAKNERTGINMTRSVKVIASIAAAVAICTTAVAAAVAGGHLVDIKNRHGAIVGQQFVDATDYFDVSLSYSQKDNQLKVEAALNENAKNEPFYGEFDSIRAAEFSIVNDNGEVVATSNGDGTIDFEFPDGAFSDISEDGAVIITMNGEKGVENYSVFVNKLIGSKKGDQDLEIFGNWDASVEITFTFVEDGADVDDPDSASICRVEMDGDGNITYYNEKGEIVDPSHYDMEFSMGSSSTFNGDSFDNNFGMMDVNAEAEQNNAVTVFGE